MTVAVTRLDCSSARDLRASAARSTDAKAALEDVGDCVGYGRVGPRGGGAELRDGPANLARLGVSLQCRGLAGLSNRTAPGRTPYLSAAQKAELSEIVRAGPDPEVDRVVRWRRIDLKHLYQRALRCCHA